MHEKSIPSPTEQPRSKKPSSRDGPRRRETSKTGGRETKCFYSRRIICCRYGRVHVTNCLFVQICPRHLNPLPQKALRSSRQPRQRPEHSRLAENGGQIQEHRASGAQKVWKPTTHSLIGSVTHSVTNVSQVLQGCQMNLNKSIHVSHKQWGAPSLLRSDSFLFLQCMVFECKCCVCVFIYRWGAYPLQCEYAVQESHVQSVFSSWTFQLVPTQLPTPGGKKRWVEDMGTVRWVNVWFWTNSK